MTHTDRRPHSMGTVPGTMRPEAATTTRAPNEDWLDAALAAAGTSHRTERIADDGFTARVFAALPAPATLPAWRRPVVAVLWTIAAGGVAVALPGTLADAGLGTLQWLAGHPISLGQIATAIAMAVTGAAAATWGAAVLALRGSD